MEFQEIKTIGKIWIQTVASNPTWTTADKGRLIFNTATGLLYFGGNSAWVTLTTGANTVYLSRTGTDSHTGTYYPTVDATYNLGGGSNRYANVYAVNFQGTSTSAKYADVAEKYILKQEYPPGTLLKVESRDKEWEMIEIKNSNDIVAGVVSDNPGFILNSESLGVPVALVGKTPVRVIGPIEKGDMIGPGEYGCGIKTTNKSDMIAIALQSYFGEGSEESIMSLLKL